MTTHTMFRTLPVAVLTSAAIALSACGGGSDDATAGTGDRRAEFREAALEFARCMREHGIDMPDPTFGEGGRMTQRLGGTGVDPEDPRFEEAAEECSKYQPRMMREGP